jgi:hypothetical protein
MASAGDARNAGKGVRGRHGFWHRLPRGEVEPGRCEPAKQPSETERLRERPTGGLQIVWARPPGARHLLVILHDCGGSALDFWRTVWSCPTCDPRPEHLKLTDQSLRSGWAVMTISSQDRTHEKCFTVRACFASVSSALSPRSSARRAVANTPHVGRRYHSGLSVLRSFPLHEGVLRRVVLISPTTWSMACTQHQLFSSGLRVDCDCGRTRRTVGTRRWQQVTKSSAMNLRLNDDLRAVEDVVERWMVREGMQVKGASLRRNFPTGCEVEMGFMARIEKGKAC